jgi:hypothetical protein
MGHYLCESSGVGILKLRLGKGISVQGLAYGETIFRNGVEIALFPAYDKNNGTCPNDSTVASRKVQKIGS